MTNVLITVDTELSAGLHRRGMGGRANFESSILGRCADGDYGIGWQMDRLDEHELKAIFFVDPMPALVLGESIIADIVGPIVDRKHEVQVHLHTEWLQWAAHSPVDARLGRNLADFSLADQTVLIGLARDLLIRAGSPSPSAFRAGNYGADDNSLRALATLGMTWDSSVNPAYLGTDCRISVDAAQVSASIEHDIAVLPVSGLYDRPGHFRPAQICAVSSAEMRAAMNHAAWSNHPAFVVVTHSFEMLARDRMRPNRSVMARFESLCRTIAMHPSLESSGFSTLTPTDVLQSRIAAERLPSNRFRTAGRVVEQILSNWRYERRLFPA